MLFNAALRREELSIDPPCDFYDSKTASSQSSGFGPLPSIAEASVGALLACISSHGLLRHDAAAQQTGLALLSLAVASPWMTSVWLS
jgi:hypothetical protein